MVPVEVSVVVGFVLAVLLAWAPLLGIERLRALFAWPTRSVGVNYLLVGSAVVIGQCVSYLGVILLVAGTGSVTGGDAAGIVGGVVGANLLVPGAAAVASLRLLPSRGYWSPDGEGFSGRFALGLGVVWYAVVTSVAFVVVALGVMFAALPT